MALKRRVNLKATVIQEFEKKVQQIGQVLIKLTTCRMHRITVYGIIMFKNVFKKNNNWGARWILKNCGKSVVSWKHNSLWDQANFPFYHRIISLCGREKKRGGG